MLHIASVSWSRDMPDRIVPMIHVPDVRATADWYQSIGFGVRQLAGEDGNGSEVTWASLTLGGSEIMLNCGGKASDAHRREFDLYIHTDDLDTLRAQLDGRVSVIEDLHDTFYGMREFIIRDINGFWITFGQPVRT
jgi:uncharacterized glyoxalase superfamily protein PhnB